MVGMVDRENPKAIEAANWIPAASHDGLGMLSKATNAATAPASTRPLAEARPLDEK